MEAREYIDEFENLVKEYKRENYLVSRYNTFEINPFTNYTVDNIPIESGYINISSYYDKAWDDANNRTISSEYGDINITDIVILAGPPDALTYYISYNDELIVPNIVSYGSPIKEDELILASEGIIYLDLTPYRDFTAGKLNAEYHNVYKKVGHDPYDWELMTDKAVIFQSNRLRYEDIEDGKYYWDIAKRKLYELNVEENKDKNPWTRYTYKMYGVDGNPTYLPYGLISDITDRYFFNRNDGVTKLYKFDETAMEWQTVGDLINYAKTDNPGKVEAVDGIVYPSDSLTLENVNKYSYYYFIVSEDAERVEAKEVERNTAVEEEETALTTRNQAETEYNAALAEYAEATKRYGEDPTEENKALQDAAYELKVEKENIFTEAEAIFEEKRAIATALENELAEMYLNVYSSGTVYNYNYTVYLSEVQVDDTFYESIYQFYRNLMHVYGDINALDRIDHTKLYLTDGHPGKKVLIPELDRIYLDTKNQKIYRPLANGFKEVERPFNTVYLTDVNYMSEIDPSTLVANTYYVFRSTNECYYTVEEDGIINFYKTTLPNEPIEVDSLDNVDLYFNAYYKVGTKYYQYNPYEEMLQEHFYFNCNVFY